MKVKLVFEAYAQNQKEHMAHATYASRSSLIRRWTLPRLSEKEIREVSAQDIDSVYDDMEEAGLAQNTLFGAYAALKSFFRFAVDNNYLFANPFDEARCYAPSRTPKEEQ